MKQFIAKSVKILLVVFFLALWGYSLMMKPNLTESTIQNHNYNSSPFTDITK